MYIYYIKNTLFAVH